MGNVNHVLPSNDLALELLNCFGMYTQNYISMENLTKLLQGQQLEFNEELSLDVPETKYAKDE